MPLSSIEQHTILSCIYFLLQHEYEPAENLKQKEGQEMSKSATKNKKKREAKARAKQEQETTGEVRVLCFNCAF